MNKTVLIIDDDDMLRDTLARALRGDGFSVLTADSAEFGRDVMQRVCVDAIILDRMMTGMDGLSFLKEMRDAGISTPVIMLTALNGPNDAVSGLMGGADDYLAKPFQMRELILRLNNIIRKSVTHSAPMPAGLVFTNDEFFVTMPDGALRMLGLSGEEKKLMIHLTSPVGNVAAAAPMVAKRLRTKINGVLSNIDIITVRGQGYKLVSKTATITQKDA